MRGRQQVSVVPAFVRFGPVRRKRFFDELAAQNNRLGSSEGPRAIGCFALLCAALVDVLRRQLESQQAGDFRELTELTLSSLKVRAPAATAPLKMQHHGSLKTQNLCGGKFADRRLWTSTPSKHRGQFCGRPCWRFCLGYSSWQIAGWHHSTSGVDTKALAWTSLISGNIDW